MNNKKLKGVVIFFVIFSLVIFFNNTAFAGGSFSLKWGKDKVPENNQVKHKYKHKKKGDRLPMLRLMDIAQSISIVIILRVTSIKILKGDYIFT